MYDTTYNNDMASSALKDTDRVVRDAIRAIPPGRRVVYEGWRGDRGEGVLLRFVNYRGEVVVPAAWGTNRLDAVIVHRDCSAETAT